jgi:hypothetical protein
VVPRTFKEDFLPRLLSVHPICQRSNLPTKSPELHQQRAHQILQVHWQSHRKSKIKVTKALHDGYLMDAFFTRAFYKHMNGTALTYEDMEDIDPDYYKNLKWILENDVTDFGICFSYQADNFGSVEERELIEGGSKIAVTNENKKEYVKLVCYDKMARTIKDQIEAFLDGLHDLVPKELLIIFDHKELELLLSGLPEINSRHTLTQSTTCARTPSTITTPRTPYRSSGSGKYCTILTER